jgi:cell division protein FtsW
VTKKEEEIAEELADKQKREDALQRMIDKQLQEEEEAEIAAEQIELEKYSIEDKANPLEPILKK